MPKFDLKKDFSPKTIDFMEKYGIVLYIWVLLVVARWIQNGEMLLRGELRGNDDHMRMVQIRDWQNGQGWFDLHQYRLNPSDPLLSHWSRMTDVIVGVPIAVLSPLIGQRWAEFVSVTVIPSLLLLVFLYLIIALTKRVSSSKVVPLAAGFMTALSFATIAQFELGRIDHHGLQIVMAILCCWFVIRSQDNIKFAAFAGIMCGLGLYVGIESAPYVGAACVAIVLTWVFNEDHAEKRLRLFGLSMAAATVGCLLISAPPSRWFVQYCDALSPVYIQLTLAVAAVMWVLSLSSSRIRKPIYRFGLAGVFGLLAILATIVLYPQCFKGPYAEVDPRLVEIWLSNVAEAKPFHSFFARFPVGGMAIAILPIFSFIAFFIFNKKNKSGFTIAPRTILIFMVMAFIAGLVQFRLMAFAASFAIPFAACLLVYSFEWADKFHNSLVKTLVRLGLVIILAPITIPLLVGLVFNEDASGGNEKDEVACYSQPALNSLNKLPTGTILTQIDIGPAILYHTKHAVTSAPYHRNTAGNLAALNMFMEDEETARQAVKLAGADYVVGCRQSNETNLMVGRSKNGTLAKMLENNEPAWMESIELEGADDLFIYRILLP